jgi:hypothetical protein
MWWYELIKYRPLKPSSVLVEPNSGMFGGPLGRGFHAQHVGRGDEVRGRREEFRALQAQAVAHGGTI